MLFYSQLLPKRVTTRGEQQRSKQTSLSVWAWCLVAVLPFILLHLFLYFQNSSYTGFIQGDQPYYVANGRAIFERGNGIGYPNPYDYRTSAPVIYYHWLPWLFGLGTAVLMFDPGVFYLLIGFIASIVGSRLLFQLIQVRVGNSAITPYLLVLFSWGSGIMVYYAFLANLFSHLGTPSAWLYFDPLQYEPYGGWWFLDWGRNNLYATEAIYHTLVLWCWLCIVKNRYVRALLPMLLIATTHPWTAVELFAMVGAWIVVGVISRKRSDIQIPISFIVTAAIIVLGFAWYYYVYLPAFPEHYNLIRNWYFPWLLPMKAFILSHFWVLILAILFLWKVKDKWHNQTIFYLTCAVAAFLLAKHDLFIQPLQPLHFTRGYTWIAIALLGVPYTSRWIESIKEKISLPTFYTFALITLLFVSVDTFTFLGTKPEKEMITLDHNGRHLFNVMQDKKIEGVFVSQDSTLSFLSATYTQVKPLLGQVHLTPQFYEKLEEIRGLYSNGSVGKYISDATLFLDSVKQPKLTTLAQEHHWNELFRDSTWVLYKK